MVFAHVQSVAQRGPWPPHFLRFLGHTKRHTTLGRTPLDEWSARLRDLYLTTHNTHIDTCIPPGAIRTHGLSTRAVGDLRIRPYCHWYRRIVWYCVHKLCILFTYYDHEFYMIWGGTTIISRNSVIGVAFRVWRQTIFSEIWTRWIFK